MKTKKKHFFISKIKGIIENTRKKQKQKEIQAGDKNGRF